MSRSRHQNILNYLAVNGPSRLGAIRKAINVDSSNHRPIGIFVIDMYQLTVVQGLVQGVCDRSGHIVYSLTRLGELIMCFAKSQAFCYKKKSSRRQLVIA